MMRRRVGFTLVELLLVIAIVGVLGGFAGVGFVGWRADSLHREVTVLVERAIMDTREESRRQSLDLRLQIDDGDPSLLARTTIVGGVDVVQRTWQLPQGVTVSAASGSPDAIAFDGIVGTQDPFEVVQWTISSGAGQFARTSDINVVPPLAITAVRLR